MNNFLNAALEKELKSINGIGVALTNIINNVLKLLHLYEYL